MNVLHVWDLEVLGCGNQGLGFWRVARLRSRAKGKSNLASKDRTDDAHE